ncbi:MAG: alpha/beta fold hydrolase, partial [Pseudomonadota bacterium]
GRGDRAQHFADAGFGAPAANGSFDVVAMDAHLGYYMERSLLVRLHDDIIAPAKAAGYDSIWLLGVSMGGLGSLLYAAEYPDDVDGIILLAPYMGGRKAIEEVLAEGTLAEWNGEGKRMKDYEVDIWRYIQATTTGDTSTPIILGFGTEDRMAEGYSGLVEKVDFTAVYTREGGHKWTTWRPLWDDIAADLEL